VYRFAALADEALHQAEAKLAMAREAEAAVALAAERYGRSGDPEDLRETERWTESAERSRREAAELRERAEDLRERIG
jgi:hypothetical protein